MRLKARETRPPRIEMLPLIDIVFLLLVFFIYAMLSMAVHRGQKVELPSSTTANLEKEQAIAVTLLKGEKGLVLLVDGQEVGANLLLEVLLERQDPEKENEVQLFADKEVDYQELFCVLDRINEAGITCISLQAEKKKP